MALGPVLAAALTDHSARTKSLTVGGLEMLNPVGTLGLRTGTLLDSVKVTEAMHGRVSSMSFTVDDPLVAITISEGMEVRFRDITNDVPIFLGFVETISSDTLGLGRTLTVTAIGVEALLDWLVIPTLTILTGTDIGMAAQQAATSAVGVGYPLRTTSAGTGGTSTQANPIAQGGFTLGLTAYDVVISGQTLRQALYALSAASDSEPYEFTVDFYGGLRVKAQAFSTLTWDISDWVGLTIDGTATPKIGQAWENTTDYSQAVHAVYVQGANAAGSGLVTDGTGIIGRVEFLSDNTSDTAAKRDTIGDAYMAQRQATARGKVTQEDQRTIGPQGTEIHAGMFATLTDATVGLSAYSAVIGQIEKSFRGAASEVWTITYGGHPPSAIGTLRKITRTLA